MFLFLIVGLEIFLELLGMEVSGKLVVDKFVVVSVG